MAEPGNRAPAPAPLRLVQEFLNTNDIEAERERFQSPGALHDWLVDHELLAGDIQLSQEDLAVAIQLREALRALTAAHNDLPADTTAAMATINSVGDWAQLAPRLKADEDSILEPKSRGIFGALGHIVAAVHRAIAHGSWGRLKACERDSCRWAFYDHSKNQSGRWCHSATCGSRERSRRAYRRKRAQR